MFVQEHQTHLGYVHFDNQVEIIVVRIVFKVELFLLILSSEQRVVIGHGRRVQCQIHIDQILSALFQTHNLVVPDVLVQVFHHDRVEYELDMFLGRFEHGVHLELVDVHLEIVVCGGAHTSMHTVHDRFELELNEFWCFF